MKTLTYYLERLLPFLLEAQEGIEATHAATLPQNTQWRAISTGHKWKLYCKQPAPPTPHT